MLGVFATDDTKLKISLTKSADRFEKKIPFLMQSSKRLPGDKISYRGRTLFVNDAPAVQQATGEQEDQPMATGSVMNESLVSCPADT